MRARWILLLAWLGSAAMACSGSSDSNLEANELRHAVASGSPAITAWATELLEGTDIAVDPMYAPEGHAGQTTPPRDRLRAARDARLVVLQGAGFAKWARQAALPSSRTVRLIERDHPGVLKVEERTHAHGAQGAHTHQGADGHTWLEPKLASEQILALGRELGAVFPAHRDQILARSEGLAGERFGLSVRLHGAGAPRALGMHGHGYGYLAEIWGGQYSEIEFALDQRLGTAEWNRLRAQLDEQGALLMIPTQASAALEKQLREELRVVCVVVPNGASAAPPESWLAQREQTIDAIAAGIESLFELRE